MDHEALFTATKWDILKLLEKEPQSPIEISKQLGSSMANVSQQLRLLEMAGLVKTRRVSNRDKDKPRILYSLAGNLSYLISTSDDFVEKKALSLSDRNKIVLRIWFLEDLAVRYALEKAFWHIEQHLGGIDLISFAGIEKGRPVIEYSGVVTLPSTVVIGEQAADVHLRKVSSPKGHVLYAKKELSSGKGL